jgi:creatinine amidohydrolase
VLSTDTVIACALADRLAAERADVVVAPAVPYGSSGEHADFPGTLSIGRDATELLLVELGRSVARSFSRLLLISAHGGNAEPVAAAVARLRAEGRDADAFFPRWGGDAHAGITETSLLLALAPGSVRSSRYEAGARAPIAELLPRLRRDGVAAVSPNGVLGDPTGACAARGEELLRAAVVQLLAMTERSDGP